MIPAPHGRVALITGGRNVAATDGLADSTARLVEVGTIGIVTTPQEWAELGEEVVELGRLDAM